MIANLEKLLINTSKPPNFFYAEISSNPSECYPSNQIHILIDAILQNIKNFLNNNFLFYPVLIKITLETEVFFDEEPQEIKIKLPKKKCFMIWDSQMLEKVLMKIHVSLLDFHSFIENPFNVILKEIKGYKIKLRNLLNLQKNGKKFLEKIIENFKGSIEPRLNFLKKFEVSKIKIKENFVNKIKEVEENEEIAKINSKEDFVKKFKGDGEIGEIARINAIFQEKNIVSKNFAIFLLEKQGNNFFDAIDNSIENNFVCIGPLIVFPSEKKDLEILFFDIETSKIMDETEKTLQNYVISEYICIYCSRIVVLEESFSNHYRLCKERMMKDSREKKMKDDLINDVNIFPRFKHFTCQKDHIRGYKMIRKPRNQTIKNEKKNKKLKEFKKTEEFKEEKEEKEEYSSLNTTISSEKPNEFIKNPSEETLSQFFPGLECWKQMNFKEKKYFYEILMKKLPNTEVFDIKDYIFKRFSAEILNKVLDSHNSNNARLSAINDFYDNFIHNSAIFSFKNEIFERSRFEKPKDLICEFKAKNLLYDCSMFTTINLLGMMNFQSIDKNIHEKGPEKINELLQRILEVSEQQKSLNFSKRNSYLRIKYKGKIEKSNPYRFFGIIKCDLEYKSDFLKKFPVLPTNNWLEFRDFDYDNLRINYKMKKNTFDDLNGYSILSDVLFYLIEIDAIEIKRIESYCEFSENNVLYESFFKKLDVEMLEFKDHVNKIEDQNNKKKLADRFIYEMRAVFLQNLYRKETDLIENEEEFEAFTNIYSKMKRIVNFDQEKFEVSRAKSLGMKIFKIYSFIYMSYVNLLNIDSILGYLLNPKNINNVVLNNSEKKLNGEISDNKRNIVVQKFSLLHSSFERVIIKYSCINSEVKKAKTQELLLRLKENSKQTYVFSHIINEYYFMRPYFFHKNYQNDEKLANINPKFIEFNQEFFTRSLMSEQTPLNHCKYSILNLPFKLRSDCRFYNKLIFEEGFSSKNNLVIELMLHNLENRYKSENPENPKAFKEIFNCNKKNFKEYMFRTMAVGMNLDTYGIKWNLDHIIPINAIKENKAKNQEIWRYENLKPLSIAENLKKGGVYLKEIKETDEKKENEMSIRKFTDRILNIQLDKSFDDSLNIMKDNERTVNIMKNDDSIRNGTLDKSNEEKMNGSRNELVIGSSLNRSDKGKNVSINSSINTWSSESKNGTNYEGFC